MAARDGYELYALTVRYGQVHAREVEAARRVAAALGVARHIELDVDLAAFGGSALVGDGDIPKDRDVDAGTTSRRPTCRRATPCSSRWRWPGRKWSAPPRSSSASTRSTTPAIRTAVPSTSRRSSAWPRSRRRPASKARALRDPRAAAAPVEGRHHPPRALELGLDYGLTHSCYDPRPDGTPCGRCDSCRLRAKGFAEAGVDRSRSRCTLVTERLYYTDPYLHGVRRARRRRAATSTAAPAVVLDRTAFYPTSGGQPFDTGTLGGAARRRRRRCETTARSCTSSKGEVRPRRDRVARARRLGAALRSHAAAHRAARAVGGVRSRAAACAPRAFISAPTRRRSIWRAS